jgi:2-oxopent-4-enoate/cis-2-oxohex-4-enoate hydratase
MNDELRQAAAAVLWEADQTKVPIAPLTETWPELDVVDAYEIQRANIRRRLEAGARVRGHKVGLSAKAMQDMLGVHEPDYGHLLDDMFCYEHDTIPMARFCQPRAEIEVAFVLGRPLEGPGVTVADVVRATDHVLPSIEIVDSRVRDWKIKIQDTVADNGSAAAFVLGDNAVDPRRVDLVTVGMVLEKNGEVIGTGAGAASLGNPVNAVTWLANKLGGFGISLKAGEVILSGSLSIMFPIQAGDSLRMRLGGVGSVSCRFA